MPKIYKHPKSYPIPNVDLLTLLFNSEHALATEDTWLHASAANPSICLNKAGLRRLTEEFAFGLRKRFGIGANGPGKDIVVVCSTGQPVLPAAWYGIIAAGGVVSSASASFTPFELARQVRAGGGNVLICSEDVAQTARAAIKELGSEQKVTLLVLRSEPDFSLRVDGEDLDGELRSFAATDRLTWERITDPKKLEESLIVLLYSSGTTGVPKGVMLSHLNLVAELMIISSPSREFIAKQMAQPGWEDPPPQRTLAHLPTAHIAGVLGYMIAPLFSGVLVFWMRKYNWPDFLRYNKEHRITTFYTVPSIYLRISKDPDVKDHFKTLMSASTGAAKMDGALQKAANRKLGVGTTFIGQTWGLSETTGAVTAMSLDMEPDETGSIAPVVPNVEVRLVDENDNDVAPGQPGELMVRGPIVTRGYFKNEKATQDSFRNGWFASGDIAVLQDGKFYIVDRLKEIIKYKGQQVAPAEIEMCLDEHPRILEAAVVGVPESAGQDSKGAESSEVPRAYVVPADNTLTAEEVKGWVKKRLSPYKQLRGGVVFMKELPKNAIGKLLRRELRDQAMKEFRREREARL